MKKWLLSLYCFSLAFSLFGRILIVNNKLKGSSIGQVLKEARSFDTILIKKGIYNESNLIIDKPVIILGDNFPVISGNNHGNIFIVKSDSTIIKGLVLQDVRTSYIEDWAAIKIINGKYCVIENNKLYNNFFSIYLQHSYSCIINNNEIKGNANSELSSGNGIHLWYSKHIVIENNKIFKHRDGIYLEYVDSSMIKNNKSYNNLRYGLHFMFSNFNVYQNNEFGENGAGVAVMFSRHIKMWNNQFKHNFGSTSYGLLLKEIYDSEVTKNTFHQNTTAIYGESVTRTLFKYNNFENNGKAIVFLGSCYENLFTFNNFISNTFEVSTDGELANNIFEKNYWSDYTGYDLNKDKIGDIPYRPISLFNYIVSKNPTSIVLLRSLFIDLLNYSEKVMPIFLPENLKDNQPLMQKVK